jgi:hypothetical protein
VTPEGFVRRLNMEDVRAGGSSRGETRNGRIKVRLFALAYILLIVFAMIFFVYFGSQMREIEFAGFISVEVIGIVCGVYWLYTKSERKGSKKGTPRGVVMLFVAGVAIAVAGWAVLFGMIALPPEAQSPHLFYLFLSSFLVGMSLVIAGITLKFLPLERMRVRVPERLLDSLQRIDPDKTFETEKFHVFVKSGIYILLQKIAWGVHFVRLFKQTPASTKKVDAPYLGWWRNLVRSFKEKAYGLRFVKVRRKFTIPIDVVKLGDRAVTKYVSGPGILYYVPLFPLHGYRDDFWSVGFWGYSPNVYDEVTYFKLDTPTIIKILKELSEEKAKDASK